MNKLLAGVRAAFKAFTMTFSSRSSWWSTWLGSTAINYAGQVADGRGNAIVEAVIQWECRTFPEAPIQVVRREGEELEVVLDHPMIQLLRHPNPFYGGVNLWMATLADWLATGNAYWVKQRSAGNRVVTLWWVPSTSIEPAWPDDGRTFISHYTYTPGTMSQDIAVADVVHFRYGMDPVNIRKGLSPLASLAREIFTDNEAANWTASLLRNGAVPSVVVSPGTDEAEFENPAEIKTTFSQEFGGDNRGGVVVMNGKTQVETLGYSPQQMDMRVVRRVPEERVTAMFGAPAVVVGLGAGLDRSTYSNMAEAREHAYEGLIIPHHRMFAEQLETQLLAEFDDINRASIAFDYSNIRVLQEDVNNLHARAREDWKAGVLTLNQTLALLGEEQLAGPEGDVRFIPISGVITPSDALIIEIPAPVAPPPMAEEPEEEEEPPPLRAVASRLATDLKAPSQFSPGVLRLRTRLVRGATPEIQAFLAGEAARVVAALRAEMKVDGSDVFDADAEAQALRVVLDPWYRRALESVSDLTQFALGISFEIDDPLTRAYLAQCGDLITSITSTTQQAIQEALVAGQAEGESYQQLARRIRGLPAFNQQRAELVARTELGAATNHATMLSFTRSGVVVGVEFTDGDEHEPCASINGRIMSLEEARSVPVLFHPNCLVGSTMVLAPSELHAAYERPFEGEVVVLRTADDRFLTCTPNHPILTNQGWVAAGLLHQGDYVIGSSAGERIALGRYPDHDHVPATIEQIARSLGPAVSGTTASMPSAAIDFHGDGMDGEVYVVRTNGFGENRHFATLDEQRGEFMFQCTDMRQRPFFADRSFAEVSQVAAHATDSSMGSVRLRESSVWSDALLPRSSSFARRAERVAVLDQPAAQATTRHADLSTQNLGTLAGLVAPVEVVSVERVQFAGQVFNLETADGWYLAEGIVTHNCTQARSPVTDVRELPKARTNGHVKEAVLH